MTVSSVQSVGMSAAHMSASVGSAATSSTPADQGNAPSSHISQSSSSSLMIRNSESSMLTGGLDRAVGLALSMKILEMLLGQKEDDQDSGGGGVEDLMMMAMLGQMAGGSRAGADMSLFFERHAESSHTTVMPTDASMAYQASSTSQSYSSVDVSA